MSGKFLQIIRTFKKNRNFVNFKTGFMKIKWAQTKQTFCQSMISFFLWILSLFRSKFPKPNQKPDGFEIKTNPFPHILIQTQSICHKILQKDTLRPKGLGLGNLFQRWLGDCLGCLNKTDPAWIKLKFIFSPLFDTNNDIVDPLMDEWELELQRLFKETEMTNKPVSVEALVAGLPLRYILRKVFGAKFLLQYQEKFEVIQKNASLLMLEVFTNQRSRGWFYQFQQTETNKALKDFQHDWHDILDVAKSCEHVKIEGKYQELYKIYESNANVVSFKMFSQTLAEIIYANKDVVVPSAAWLLTHYSLHPSVGDPLLFIEESARLCPVFPTSMPKIIMTDILIDNIKIPKGTTVLMDFVALGRSSDWQMSDLDKFRTERYKEVNRFDMVTRFGYGGRQCPGQNIANTIFRRMLNHLSQNWNLIPSHPYTSSIKNDPAYPFSMPLFNVWLFNIKNGYKLNPRSIYYDCPPTYEISERAFLAVSINETSPFLRTQQKADMVVKILAQRNAESIVLLADDIAKFNIQAFNHWTPKRSQQKATELGNTFAEMFNQSIKNFGQGKVGLCRWANLNLPVDIENTFQKFPELCEKVSLIAQNYLDGRGQGKVSKSYEKKINLVTKYIFNELPVLICGVEFQEKWYNLLYYCGGLDYLKKFTDEENSLHRLALDIVFNEKFSEIKEEISRVMGKVNRYKIPGFIGIDTNNDG